MTCNAQLVAISQMVDGTLLGVGTDQQLWTCPALGQTWTGHPGSGSMLAAIQLFDGTLLGVGTDQQLATTTAIGGTWSSIVHSAYVTWVAQDLDGTLIGVQNQGLSLGRYSHLLGAIDHVVVFMLENRGFDSLLGYLYSPQSPPSNVIPASDTQFKGLLFPGLPPLANPAVINGQRIALLPSPPVRATDSPGTDPFEEFEHVNMQFFGSQQNPPTGTPATMQGFLADFAGRWGTNPTAFEVGEIEQIMAIYTPADVPVISTLAKAYAVSDEWFSSVPTQTNANRAFSLAGTSLGEVNNGFLATSKPNHDLAIDSFMTETIFNVLQRSQFTNWGVFVQTNYPPHRNYSYTWQCFPMIEEYIPGASSHFYPLSQFMQMAKSGTLPAFSYLEPYWGGAVHKVVLNGNDYHPPADTVVGELFLKELFGALMQSPIWPTTLLMVTFDEHGGTYDHVPPPWNAAPPWGEGKPPFALERGFAFNRFGARIPTLLISPLIEEGTVFRSPTSVPYDHTSMLATVLDWQQVDKRTWNLGARTAAAPTFDNVVTLATARTDNPFAPTPPPAVGTPLNYGDAFYLTNQTTGKSLIQAWTKWINSYFHPQLGASGPVAHTFRLGYGPLTSGAKVQLFTSQFLDDNANIQQGNVVMVTSAVATAVGDFSNQKSCYYYPTEDFKDYQEQVWTITKVGATSGSPICYGDSVNLVNVSTNLGLIRDPYENRFLMTAAGAGDVWMLTPAPG